MDPRRASWKGCFILDKRQKSLPGAPCRQWRKAGRAPCLLQPRIEPHLAWLKDNQENTCLEVSKQDMLQGRFPGRRCDGRLIGLGAWRPWPALPSAHRALPFLEVSFREASLSTWLGYHLLCPHIPDPLLLFLFQSTDLLQTPNSTPIDMDRCAWQPQSAPVGAPWAPPWAPPWAQRALFPSLVDPQCLGRSLVTFVDRWMVG